MKRIIFITTILLLMSSVCFGQIRDNRMPGPPSPLTGNATDGYSLPGSLAIGGVGDSYTLTLNGVAVGSGSGSSTFTTGLAAADARLGVSPLQLSAATVLTTSEFDGRTYYLSGNSPPFIVQFPAISTATGYAVNLMDSLPDGGVTIFDIGTSLWYGVGSSSGTATTIWANAGARASGWTLTAFPTIRAGQVVIRIIAPDLSWYSKP